MLAEHTLGAAVGVLQQVAGLAVPSATTHPKHQRRSGHSAPTPSLSLLVPANEGCSAPLLPGFL